MNEAGLKSLSFYEISVMPARGCFITVVRLTPEVAAEVAAALLDRRPTR